MNKKQKEWLSEFFNKHPDYQVSRLNGITKLGEGEILLTLERTEWIYMEATPREISGGYQPGLKWHYIKARLSKKGELLTDLTYSSKVMSYPHCSITPDEFDAYDLQMLKIKEGSQLTLPFHQAVLTLKQSPLLKGSFYQAKQCSRRKQERETITKCRFTSTSLQRELPLLKPKVLASDTKFVPLACNDGALIQVPEYLVKLLEEANASPSEKADAADLYAITGLKGAINFVEALPYFRSKATNPINRMAIN